MASEFDDEFLSDEELELANMERAVYGNETSVQHAERLIQEAVPSAARAIIHLATDRSVQDRVRLSAAQYIIDRACGKAGDGAKGDDGKAPWDGLYEAVTKSAASQ